jgi:acetolactate synthase-1/2/3 large subunit
MWTAQYYKFNKPRHFSTSGGLGTMGFGLPAALGAQIANPNKDVLCITSEASIQMNIQELATCQQYKLPLNIIMLNNGFMGMVRQWQEFFYDKRYSQSTVAATPDFVKLAESYGHVGIRVDKPSDVEDALKEAIAMKDRLVFLDFIIEAEENVYPMVAAGKGHNEMMMSPMSNDISEMELI